MSLRSGPLHYEHFDVSFPDERVVQVTLNRPEKLNSINKQTSAEIAKIWERFDEDESLWVAIITGNGRAFCTGADLGGKWQPTTPMLLVYEFNTLTKVHQNGMQWSKQE